MQTFLYQPQETQEEDTSCIYSAVLRYTHLLLTLTSLETIKKPGLVKLYCHTRSNLDFSSALDLAILQAGPRSSGMILQQKPPTHCPS